MSTAPAPPRVRRARRRRAPPSRCRPTRSTISSPAAGRRSSSWTSKARKSTRSKACGRRSRAMPRFSRSACITCRITCGRFRCCCGPGATTTRSSSGRTTRRDGTLSATRYPARGCPVCGSAERDVLFRQEFAAVEAATPVTGYDVAVCARCGAGYADGIPTQAEFDRYYRMMSKYEYAQRQGAESEYDTRRLELIAGIVAPRLPSASARILDVGCASGRLLANLRDRGFPNVVGLDPSPACVAAAARLYAIDARTMTLEEMAAAGERFDVVIMVGVLEHLRDLDAAFAHLRAVVSGGGLLYVEVPDATAFADWDNAPYQDFSTEHINFFAPISLDNLM